MRSRFAISLIGVLALASLVAAPRVTRAWEAATTHAGLTEQAALSSPLHERLRDAFGMDHGLFAALTVPPADAPELFEILRALNPTHGYVPDSRGRLPALGWLAAGAVVADMPPAHAAHHFFDPLTGEGLSGGVRGLAGDLRHRLQARLVSESLVLEGMAAPAWVVHEDNPMGLGGFVEQYARAVSSRTPGERSRHLAGALVAAGAMMHVLQDMASPSHVRADVAAHFEEIGPGEFDVGSRFERVAALAYGRLGVPAPAQVASQGIAQATTRAATAGVQALFTAEDGSGLADRTAQRFFSANTLPRSVRVVPGAGRHAMAELLADSLVRPLPAPLPGLDLQDARGPAGARLTDERGVCVARYRLRDDVLTWYMDDACMAEQAAVLLPEAAGYSTALLGWLFRGAVEMTRDGGEIRAVAAGAEFGPGTVELFWDDGSGVRAALGEPLTLERAAAGSSLVQVPAPPQGARGVAVLFRGKDQHGQPLVAAGYLSL